MLLTHLGRDVAGALSIVPADATGRHGSPSVHPYAIDGLEQAALPDRLADYVQRRSRQLLEQRP